MARYDVHANDDGYFYVEVQAENWAHLNTRAVVPLIPVDLAPIAAKHLNPIFDFGGQRLTLVTQYLGASRLSVLGPVVGSLAHEHDRISAALDRLLTGF